MTPKIWDRVLQHLFITDLEVRWTAAQLRHYMNGMLKDLEDEHARGLSKSQFGLPTNESPPQTPPELPPELPPGFQEMSHNLRDLGSPISPPSRGATRLRDSTLTQDSEALMSSPGSAVFDERPAMTSTGSNVSDPRASIPGRWSDSSPPPVFDLDRRTTDLQDYTSDRMIANGRAEREKRARMSGSPGQTSTQLPLDDGLRIQETPDRETMTPHGGSPKVKERSQEETTRQYTNRSGLPRSPTPQLTVGQLKAWATLTRQSRTEIAGFNVGGSKDFPLTGDPMDPQEPILLRKMEERDHVCRPSLWFWLS